MTKRVGTALDPSDAIYDDVANIPSDTGVSAGIRLRTLMNGMVPIFEEHLARKSEGYNLQEWRDLDRMERAITVAVFRTEKSVESHHMDAQSDQMNSKNK